MDASWEDTFRSWAKGPSPTEQTKYENAERMIKDAIREYDAFLGMEIETFAHGSFKRRTNVRQNGDVDVCVCLKSTFFYELPTGTQHTPGHFGIVTPGSISYEDFKDLVEAALGRV